MAQEQGSEQDCQGPSLNLLLANTLISLEQKLVDFPSLIAILSLFNLFSVLNNPVQGQTSRTAPAGLGGADLLGMLTSMLGGGGGSPGADMAGAPGGLMQKQGNKNLNPQLLMTLLSLLSEARSSAGPAGGPMPAGPGAAIENVQQASPERRPFRG